MSSIMGAPSKSVFQHARDWGSSSLPPSLLATLTTALHARPPQLLPLTVFTPTLLFASYLNLAGYPTAAAGISSAFSGTYALLALRRRHSLRQKLSIRGVVRGGAVALAVVNCVTSGWVYLVGSKDEDKAERERRNRWG